LIKTARKMLKKAVHACSVSQAAGSSPLCKITHQ
jgi:hypothetical protein